jgi:hypothetical protein
MVPRALWPWLPVSFCRLGQMHRLRRNWSGNHEIAKSSIRRSPDPHGQRYGAFRTWKLEEKARRRAIAGRVRVDAAGEYDVLRWDPGPTNL